MADRRVSREQAGGAQRAPQRLQRVLWLPLVSLWPLRSWRRRQRTSRGAVWAGRGSVRAAHSAVRGGHGAVRAAHGAGWAGSERVHAGAGGLAVHASCPGRTGGLARPGPLTARGLAWASLAARTTRATGTAETALGAGGVAVWTGAARTTPGRAGALSGRQAWRRAARGG